MDALSRVKEKRDKLAIGLMSGTSMDGIDAVLVEITGAGLHTQVRQVDFVTVPFEGVVRERLLQVATGRLGGSEELSQLNFLLGELLAEASLEVCRAAGVSPQSIDFVGSHGQTVFHHPDKTNYLGREVSSTLQIGEASVIAEKMGCVVVSDFRVRDIAAGGLGAPLVPYTEYVLYQDSKRHIALQNIGGIGNITLMPKGGALEDLIAFDTGPGNMVIDGLIRIGTQGKMQYDKDGKIAERGKVNDKLLRFMIEDDYLDLLPPKTTGREVYGEAYVSNIYEKGEKLGLDFQDIIATATYFTAETIRIGIEKFAKYPPERLIVGGGGSRNPVLMSYIKKCLPDCEVLTNEEIGRDSEAKEAIAFAVLANETLYGLANNSTRATGAKHPVVMGKISF